ncbi:MAG: T9SS type A sorting domain-containing protein [Bacteroidota bacterium]
MKKTILLLGFCLLGWGTSLYAQQGTVGSGGESSGTGGKVSYTIGQIDYLTETSTGGTITQGLQQPIEIYVYTGIEETGINLITTVYPNPAIESVTLKVDNGLLTNLSYQLFDIQGKLISKNIIANTETLIDLSQLASAKYFLKVTKNDKELKTFKIIKLK